MFEAHSLLYIYVETPLHAGSGQGLGAVDLPIQREWVTGYPTVQGSGIKGKLRSAAYQQERFRQRKAEIRADLIAGGAPDDRETTHQAERQAAQELGLEAVFGPPTEGASEHAGALAVGDGRLLLFPVRSLAGIFAWTTSVDALARFVRDAMAARQTKPFDLPDAPGAEEVLVATDDAPVVAGGKVVLEEFAFTPRANGAVRTIGERLARNALPEADEYQPWIAKLPNHLVILPEDAFRDFTQFATEVVSRVRLDRDKKTVVSGALWTEESLPVDTLLYAPLHAARPRGRGSHGIQDAAGVLNALGNLDLTRIQLGGDETVGRGMVYLRLGPVVGWDVQQPAGDEGEEEEA